MYHHDVENMSYENSCSYHSIPFFSTEFLTLT
nr:MAG TPA: hypothetical protein [Caudoviricetes sp.]